MSKKKTVWIGQIESIFGYGIIVVEDNEYACNKALRKAYNEWVFARQNTDGFEYPDTFDKNGNLVKSRFEQAMEYWGGSVFEVVLGKSYCDGFKL